VSKVDEWKARHVGEISKAWDELLRQPWGRQLLFEILDSTDFCGVDASTYYPDSAQQSYRNGIRDAGLKLRLAAQEANPEMYLRMVSESMNTRRMLLIAQRADADAAKEGAQ